MRIPTRRSIYASTDQTLNLSTNQPIYLPIDRYSVCLFENGS